MPYSPRISTSARSVRAKLGTAATTIIVALLFTIGFASTASASTIYAMGGSNDTAQMIPIDTATNLPGAGIMLGGFPTSMATSPDGKTVYAIGYDGTANGQGWVKEIDVETDTITRTISDPALSTPLGAAISPDGDTLYVPRATDVTSVDLTTGTAEQLIQLDLGLNGNLKGGAAVSPDGDSLYLTATLSKFLVIDTGSGTLDGDAKTLADSGKRLRMSSDGNTLYSPSGSPTVGVFDVPNSVALPRINTPGATPDAQLTSDGDTLFVLAGTSVPVIAPVDTVTGTVGTSISISPNNNPSGMVLSPSGLIAYVIAGQKKFAVVNLETGAVESSALPISTSSIVLASPETIAPPADPVITVDGPRQSGTVGDSTNPDMKFEISQLDGSGDPVSANDLSVTATSSNPSVLPSSAAIVSTDGLKRKVSFEPVGPGITTVTLTVTGQGGLTETASFDYWVSKETTPTSHSLQGFGDVSTAIDVGDGHLLIADDEQSYIGLYRGDRTGRPLATNELGPASNALGEIDFESAARSGDSVYWLGSHGNNKTGGVEPSRHTVIATKLTGTAEDTTVARTGSFGGLRADLIAWDQSNADRYGFADGTRNGVRPDLAHGFNIEAAEFAPNGTSLYLGFRSPLVPATTGGDALIVPVDNIKAVTAGKAEHATFGEPIELDLDGMAIRELRRNERGQYLILGGKFGPGEDTVEQALFSWTGKPGDEPVALTTNLPYSAEIYDDAPGAWEAIAQIPDRLVAGAPIRLIMDQGYERLYLPDTTLKNKQDTDPRTKKSRIELFNLTGNVGPALDAGAPTFPSQAAGTTGAGQWVTVRNTGAQELDIARVRVIAGDDASAGDFLIGQDGCGGETIGTDDSCRMLMRFAPAREDATSSADLVFEANLEGGEKEVQLTGTSTRLPAGPTGPTGAKGENGPNGTPGPTGPAGRNGRDGSFRFSPTKSRVKVRRGQTARLSFTAANRTGSRVSGARATVSTPTALKSGATKSIKLDGFDPGQVRSVRFKLKVGHGAGLGRHTVKVRLKIANRSVVREVELNVRR